MPTVLRFRRGDTTASNAFTGAEGELFVDTSKDTVVVHDGVTAGGKPLATEAALNSKQATLVSGTNIKTVNGTSILGSGDLTVTGGVSTITASGGSETTSWSLASNNWNWGDRSGNYSFYGYSVDSTFITKVGSLSSGDTVRFIGQSGYDQSLIVDYVTVQSGYFTIYLQQTEPLGFSSWIAMDFTIDTSNTTVSSELTLAKTLKFPDNSIQTTAYTGVGLATTSDLSNGLQTRQAILVSGTNIKTVNGTSLLGSGNIAISGGGSTDLTQVSSDIIPLFDSVYDLGSATNRFYDAYLGNKLDINDATLSGTSTLVSAAVPAVIESVTIIPITYDFPTSAYSTTNPGGSPGGFVKYDDTTGSGSFEFDIQSQPELVEFVTFGNQLPNGELVGSPWTNTTSILMTIDNVTYTLSGLSTSGGGGGNNFGFNFSNATPNLPNSLGGYYTVSAAYAAQYGYALITSLQFVSTRKVYTAPVAAVPAVYDYTLASNATIVTPTVVADTALLGTNYFELDTITPAHILGEYTDTPGTLIVNGNLKVTGQLLCAPTTLTTAGDVDISFIGATVRTQGPLTGNVTYTASNYTAGSSVTIRVIGPSDGGTPSVTFPSGWVFVGTKPTMLDLTKTAILTVTSFGTTEADCVASWAVNS